MRKPVEVQGKKIMLQSWDTAGTERFRTITMSYYRSAMGAIICFDCTSEQSLKSAKTWIKDFRDKARPGAPILLVATKLDLQLEEQRKRLQEAGNQEPVRARIGKSQRESRLLLPVQPLANSGIQEDNETDLCFQTAEDCRDGSMGNGIFVQGEEQEL